MKCISLWQPWASLCVIGAKQFETRGWATRYRGPLLIHAAQKWTPDLRRILVQEPFHEVLASAGYAALELPRGAIIGAVDLVEIHMTARGQIYVRDSDEWETVPEPESRFGDFGIGRYAWRLANPCRFRSPIPYRGLQQLFEVPAAAVADQLAEARTA